ncbi:MAG: LamG-like jellyroll fold domain-containing protein [Nostoc sp. ChiQUE01a]|nr:LamG-like jellyroll fold domain-containing protein [Nostoc sp. ChiQUE01a]
MIKKSTELSNNDNKDNHPTDTWINENMIPIGPLQSNAGEVQKGITWEQEPEEETEGKTRFIEIIKERMHSVQPFLISALTDAPDFLPTSFLPIGEKTSLAVCRIRRNFSLNEFKDFLGIIENSNSSLFANQSNIEEVFSIPKTVSSELFKNYCSKNNALTFLKENINNTFLSQFNPIAWGTGFLVGGNYLLTNNHVISSPNIAKQCIAQFNYIEDNFTTADQLIDYKLEPECLFICNPNLDYTLVQLKGNSFTKHPGYSFGWIKLIEDDKNILPGFTLNESELTQIKEEKFTEKQLQYIGFQEKEGRISGDIVLIVQHPKGMYKKIVLHNNKIIDNGIYKNFLRYTLDSDYGSSGSPVFNRNWELVALHHAHKQNVDKKSLQQGIRIYRIIEDLKIKSFANSKLRNFIQDYVVTAEQLNNPPLPSALELDGVNDYVLLENFQHGNPIEEFSIEAWICPYSNEVETTVFSKFYQSKRDDKIATLGYDSLRVYITTDGKIVLSRKMHSLPTLPLELPKEPESKQEVLFNLQRILQILWRPEGNTNYDVQLSGEEDELTKKAIQEFKSDYLIQKTNTDISPQLLDNLNSQITFLNLYNLNYDEIDASNEQNMTIRIHKKPSKGEIVKALQNILINLEYECEINGEFDEKTKNAVKSFQAECGLEKDGVFGPLTQKILTNIQSFDVKTQANVIKFGKFNHISITYTSKSIYIYVNGQFCQSEISSDMSIDNIKKLQDKSRLTQISIDSNQGSPLIIGAYSRKNLSIPNYFSFKEGNLPLKEGYLSSFFRGAIAEVRLWNKALSCENVQKNMSRRLTGKEPGLIGYWRFEEGEGDKVRNLAFREKENIDYSSQIYRITQQSEDKATSRSEDKGTSRSEEKVIQQSQEKWLIQSNFPCLPLPYALKFDGKDDRVDCGNDPGLSIQDGITIEAWIKHVYGNGLVTGREDANRGYSLAWVNGRIRVELKNEPNFSLVETQEIAPSDRRWHHIAFTWGKIVGENRISQEEIEIYIDGLRQNCVVLKGEPKSVLIGGQYKTWGLFKSLIGEPNEKLYIGGSNLQEQDSYFNGFIAEVRLWKVARTQDQIQTNMYRRLQVHQKDNAEGLVGYWRLDDLDEENRNLINLAPLGKAGKHHSNIPQPSVEIESANTQAD